MAAPISVGLAGVGERRRCVVQFSEDFYTSIDNPIGYEIIGDEEASIWSDYEETYIEMYRINNGVRVLTQVGNIVVQFFVKVPWAIWLAAIESIQALPLEEMSRDDWEARFREGEAAPVAAAPPPEDGEPGAPPAAAQEQGAADPGVLREGGKRKTRARKTKRRKTLRRK